MDVIRIETRCNNNCLFCGADPQNLADYSLELNSVIQKLNSARPDSIIEVSGGEPTLSPMLPKILFHAKKRGLRISLQTNAMRFANRRFTELMTKAGLTHAFVSLHAPDAKLSDAITRTPGAFKLTVSGIENLIEQKIHVSLNFVICTLNQDKMLEYVRFVDRQFKHKLPVVFSFINPFYNAWKHQKMIPAISSIMDELNTALLEGERLGLEMHVPDICGIPICFLHNKERFADKCIEIKEGRAFNPNKEKVKGTECYRCKWDNVCDGLWKRYSDKYGFDELVPVLESSLENSESSSKRAKDTAFLVGQSCQNNCIFCNEGGGASQREQMSLQDARVLLKKTKPEWVFLSGGEPTTCKNLVDYVKLAKQYKVDRVTLVSNGSGVADYALIEELVKAGLNEVRLSVHGFDSKSHDKQTRYEGSYAQILEAISNCMKLKKKFKLDLVALVVVNSLNMYDLEKIIFSLIKLGFEKIGLGTVDPRRNADVNFSKVVPRFSEMAQLIEDAYLATRQKLEELQIEFYVDSLPACLVDSDTLPLGERSVISTLNGSGELWQMLENRDKVYGAMCDACPKKNICEGVWLGYIERYGWSEFE